MPYFVLEPEVAGGWGEHTVADRSSHPPKVTHLHYEFQGWLGDELLESFPCFIVTQRLANRLRSSQLSGFSLSEAEVSASDKFMERHPGQELPSFEWLQVLGTPGVDDFALSVGARLVVSQTALDMLQEFPLEYCDVASWPG
jgi:hypothetical protein